MVKATSFIDRLLLNVLSNKLEGCYSLFQKTFLKNVRENIELLKSFALLKKFNPKAKN